MKMSDRLSRLLDWLCHCPPPREPVTHDYWGPHRQWGHDFVIHHIYSDKSLRISLWSEVDIEVGDYLLMDVRPATRTTRYRVKDIRRCADPQDMFSATLEFAPRAAYELTADYKRGVPV